MKRQINFVVCSNDDQEMIVNFYPPLVIDDDEDTPYKFTKWGQIKEALSELLIYYDGNPARVTAFDEEAIGLLEDRDDKQVYKHRTIFGSEITATFDKVGVRLQVKDGSMVFISAGAQDAIIAIKPGH